MSQKFYLIQTFCSLCFHLLERLLLPSSSDFKSYRGLRLQITGVVPILLHPRKPFGQLTVQSNQDQYSCFENLLSLNQFPIVNHPFLKFKSFPKSQIFFLPKQNLSMISYISTGFSRDPISGYQVTITSMSMFGWIKLWSEAFFASPLYPTKQCSLTRIKIPSSLCGGAFFLITLVFIQTISQHLLKPHFLKSSRPQSKCQEPTQRKIKEGESAIFQILRFKSSCRVQDLQRGKLLSNIFKFLALFQYYFQGGSQQMISNFPRLARSYYFKFYFIQTAG